VILVVFEEDETGGRDVVVMASQGEITKRKRPAEPKKK
jgi:hypothetical protein